MMTSLPSTMIVRLSCVLLVLAAAASAQFSLTTTFVSNNGQSGNMFDVQAISDVAVKGFDVHLQAGTWDVEIYRRTITGSYVGHQNNPASWTRIARYDDVVSAGVGVATPLPQDLCERIAPGTTRAFYVTTTTPGAGINYTTGTVVGAIAASDPRLRILEGAGAVYPFGSSFAPRVFNGTIHYGTVIEVPADFATIQAAINASVNGQVIWVAPGNYNQNVNFIGKAVRVCSSGGPASTTINGGNVAPAVRFITGEGATSELRGFRVTGGLGALGQGGGIHCQDASPTIRNCNITGNTGGGAPAAGGFSGAGGVHGSGFSGFALYDCDFSNNTGGSGNATTIAGAGGIYSRGNFRVERCTLSFNQGGGAAGGIAGAGAVFYGQLASIDMRDCTVRDNTGGNGLRGGAGGIAAFGDSAGTISDSRVHHNHGGSGTTGIGGAGGIDVNNAHALVRNTLVYLNIGGTSGVRGGAGGFNFESDSSARVVNCSVSMNLGGFAPTAGPGGMFFQNVIGNPDVTNTILWNDSTPETVVVMIGPNAIAPLVTYCDVQGGFAGAGNISANPLFVNAGAGDFHLQAASPCIDAGSPGAPSGIPATDFEGDPRSVFSGVDIGADEFKHPALAGTSEDLEIEVRVNGALDYDLHAGDLLTLRLHSPNGTFVGAVPVLAAQLYPNGTPPVGLAGLGLPAIHLDLGSMVILFNGTLPSPFGPFALPPGGMTLGFSVGTSFIGSSVRAQGIALSPSAANGSYAATGAYDLVFH